MDELIGCMIENNNSLRKYYTNRLYLNSKIKTEGKKSYNRKSKKIILLNYIGGSGGNFFNNCLSLSPSIKIGGLNTLEEKIDYIKKGMCKIIIEELNWRDVLLIDKSEELVNGDISKAVIFKSHEISQLEKDLNFWIDPKIIIFKNTLLFRYLRTCIWKGGYYDTYCEYSIEKFLNLNENKKQTIKLYFESMESSTKEYDYYKNLEKNNKILYIWDTNWYLSLDKTLFHLNEIYKLLELEDFNKEIITWYYNTWIDTMNQLKNEFIKKKYENFRN